MGTTSAGRSTSITNISGTGGGSIMGLEATLDNTLGTNSSPIYTTIPTPFFCINVPANNNPGAVDANGDLLSYNLVPGITGTSGTVTYNVGYSATAPLAVSTGSFSFSSTTGQLAFTPNLVQRSLVVFRVDEYRGSTLVGSSMREMTFVVLNNCSNNPPTGNISNNSGGTITGAGKIITVCKSEGNISFNINPTDAEGDGITMVASGVPAGAVFNVTNNGSAAPTGSFAWNLSAATPGTYNMFVNYKDDGCPLSSTQTIAYTIIVLPDPGNVFSLISPATCSRKARFTVTPSGSPSPWTITIRQGTSILHTFTGVTSSQLDSLDPGTYTIRVTNSNNCFKDTTITLNPPPVIYPAVNMVKPTCYGGSNGSITLNASGGVSPFTYALGSGTYSSTNVFTGLAAGSYTLHIKDAYDCIKDTTVQLQDPPQITLSIVPSKPKCNFYSSGAITVTAANGTAPYQYALGSGSFSSTNTFSGLFSGTYVIHVKDANNCTKDSTYQLIDSIIIHATASVTNVLCYGDTTGAITLTGNSGASPYVYRIGAAGVFGSSGTFSPLPAGTHNFRIKDADSCYLDTAVTITQPNRITSTSSIAHVTCYGLSDAAVTITATGGVSPYQYAIGSGSFGSTNTFSGLAAGNYTLHIKDDNGCLKDTIITVTQPAVLAFSNIQITQPVCSGDLNGFITITGTGGTTAYTYAINTSSYVGSSTFSGLGAGTYTLHLKDANNCQVDSVVTMGQPTPIIPTLQVKQSTCFPLNDGRVIVTATGGVPSYVYAVGTGTYSSSNTFTPLAAGTYTFHIRDTRLCIKDTTITIIDSTVVNANYVISNVKCFGESSGSITVNTTSGKSPFTYAINTNPYGTSPVFGSLPVGSYAISIKDNLGCKKDTTLPITEPTVLQVFVSSVTSPRCYGFNNGGVNLFAFGGTSPYSYAVDAGPYGTSGNFTTLKAGTYTFHIKDANNCIKDTVIIVTQPDRIIFQNVVITNVLCHGDTSGSAVLTGTGGVAPLLYASDNSAYSTNQVQTGFNAGYHIIRIKDANNCYLDSTIEIKEPTKLLLSITNITPPTCDGYPDGSVTMSATGGITPYKFSASNGSQSTSGTIGGLQAGSYTFTVTDGNNCVVDTNIVLSGYPAIVIDSLDIFKVTCNGLSDGKIMMKVSGGIPPLMYQLENRTPVTVSAFYDLIAATYKIRIIDDKNCFKDTTVKMEQPDKLVTKINVMPNDCEGYDNDGLVKAEVTGGTKPYNYLWSMANAGNKAELSGIPNGPYRVQIVDSNSCKDSASAVVAYDNCCKVFIPDAFTPNGDGRNDKAKILYKGDFTLEKFAIFNRFGQKVFETNIITDGWDGKFNGQLQDLGTFNYYIKGICGNGGTKEVEFKGNVTLLK
jgi:gliding motility-associated-like protein